jgi:16S rRNA (guanine527-N7)-methyltransferase
MHPINKHHYDLLEKWRHAMDLVGPSDIDHHFEDAINSVQYLPECETWADLGSGAGFPGFALAAQQPNAFVSMIESRQKRCAFLRNVVRTAQIKNIEIIQSRTEKIDTLFGGVISRAYKPPLSYLTDAARLLRPDGVAVLMAGSEARLTLPNEWLIKSKHEYPVGNHTRCIWILQFRRQS